MKPSRLTLSTLLVFGLAAMAWAQDAPPPPDRNQPRVPLDEAVLPKDAADVEEIDLPEVDYPEPVTDEQKKAAAKHEEGSQGLAIEQDELSADVQELIEEQTDEGVIQLLERVEEIMAEVIDSLDQTNTGGGTIAAETEIIEKIYEAAQQRAQQSGGT